MIANGRDFPLTDWSPGDKIGATHLNEALKALRAMTTGSEGGAQNKPAPYSLDFPSVYGRARVVLTDNTVPLSGLKLIDGVSLSEGDYVLAAQYVNGATGGPLNDGLYAVKAAGSWRWLVAMNYQAIQTSNQNPLVYPHGFQITIWDGATAPRIFVASTSGVTTF